MIDSVATWMLLRELRMPRSHEALRALQGRRLREQVRHAWDEIPFYPSLWQAAGLDPRAIRGIDDLSLLPIVSSAQARAAAERGDLLARGVPPTLPRFATSGSSGVPLYVPRGRVEGRLWRAAGLRARLEHGVSWRAAAVQFDAPAGPPHVLARLGISPTTWLAPGTPLEAQIEHVFGAHAISLYGTTETGYVGWECEQRGLLHVNAELFAVELLRDGRPAAPGELARIVVTDLRGRTAPLLRWDTGDVAVVPRASCACGRSLPTIA